MWVILEVKSCKIDTFSYFALAVMQCTYAIFFCFEKVYLYY